MHKFLAILAALVASFAIPQIASAERGGHADYAAASPFMAAPVSDSMLSDVRGGTAPFAALTVGTAHRIVDDSARADLRLAGSVGRIEMDVWWGTVGSELIAQSVRGAASP